MKTESIRFSDERRAALERVAASCGVVNQRGTEEGKASWRALPPHSAATAAASTDAFYAAASAASAAIATDAAKIRNEQNEWLIENVKI